MSEHLAFARKYRPDDFDDIVGQEHIAVTLKNAISQSNLAHAFLFSGPRGIGKTSTARILAKALNCQEGPTPKPCNKCSSCVEIREGRSMDVLEIDGASNTGVDNIRDLRENVKFSPANGRYKIYIIDEVHMLSTSAFNALLKTLEEPPSHVKFIFATTEPHNVLPTVLSRCQRFDFHKISANSIVQTLKKLSTQEKIKIEEEALYALARAADGSLRDAEVILEQMNSFSQGKITLEDVNTVLGLVSQDAMAMLVENMALEKLTENIIFIDTLLKQGRDPSQLVVSLIEYFRQMMLIKCGCAELVTLPLEDKEKIKKQVQGLGLENILYCLAVLSQAHERIKKQGMGRLFLEMVLVKLSRHKELSANESLLKKIHALEDAAKKFSAIPQVQKKNPAVSATRPEPSEEKPASAPSAKAPATAGAKKEAKPLPISPIEAIIDSDNDQPLSLELVKKTWPHLVRAVKKDKMALGIYLSEGKVLNYDKNIIELGFLAEHELHRDSLMDAKNLKFIEDAAKDIFGRVIKLKLVKFEPAKEEPEALEPEPEKEPEVVVAKADPEDGEEPAPENLDEIIQSAIDVFNGRIIQNNED